MLRVITLGLLLAGLGCRPSTTTAPAPKADGEQEATAAPKPKPETEPERTGDPKAISGKVTLDGRPVTGAAVVFASVDGAVEVHVAVEADGTYELPPFEPGKYRVAIVPEPPPQDGKGKAEPAKGAAIPERYRHPATSGLTVEVRGGGHVFDFKLNSR